MSDGTTPQQGSHRPWMRNGIAFTGNRDHGYLGQKANGADNTDMVLHWSDNPGVAFKDRLRFIFTSAYTGVPSGAGSQEGLEAMRIFPARSDQAFVGIGDYYAGNLLSGGAITEPEERLSPAQERLLRIAPNPFTDRTTLYCTLERAGRMQLLVNSSDGRDLRVLSEGQREAGEFQHEWRTEHLAPGVYYVTLLLDGEPLVKRAVKVGR